MVATASRVLASVGLLGILLSASGCGSSTGTVSGKVYYKDQALKGGTVTFVPISGKGGSSSPIAEDGRYTIQDFPIGEAKIAVETKSMKPSGLEVSHQKQNLPKDAPAGAEAYRGGDPNARGERYVPIPDLFNNPEKSGQTYIVVSGSQEHEIRLK